MRGEANPDNVVRCGFDPPDRLKLQEIYVHSRYERKIEDFCIYFNITHAKLKKWCTGIRAMLREDSTAELTEQSFRIRGDEKLVFADIGKREFWQLEPGTGSEIFFDALNFIGRLTKSKYFESYFDEPEDAGSQQWHQVTEYETFFQKTNTRWVPSHRMKLFMLNELAWWEAKRMKRDKRLQSLKTENQVKQHSPFNKELEPRQASPTKKRKVGESVIKLMNCAIYVIGRDMTNNSIAEASDSELVKVQIRDILDIDEGDDGRQGGIKEVKPGEISWVKLQSELVGTPYDVSAVGQKSKGTLSYKDLIAGAVQISSEKRFEEAVGRSIRSG